MMPMHYVNKSWTNPLHAPQKTEPYFTIRVDATWNYVAGDTVEGTIIADQHYFEGFLVQAHNSRKSSSWRPVGDFSIVHSDVQLACSGQAVTHSQHKHYQYATFFWTAPAVRERTCIHFVATIVKGYSTFFMGVTSKEVCIDPIDGMGSAPADVRAGTTGLLLLLALTTALFARA
ncbi:hypothetical protein RRG08_015623 [Elysia crispata]|uniref:Reelin domain-containing protein n=1 Tax=Elysia crispata TaxID=231223 RepID=A0AAE0Y863_9GAST|nr:hypothetical protein RRG08_015623 [Elysia crispata]